MSALVASPGVVVHVWSGTWRPGSVVKLVLVDSGDVGRDTRRDTVYLYTVYLYTCRRGFFHEAKNETATIGGNRGGGARG